VRLTRVYVDAPLAAGTRVTLEGGAARHVTRVLRLRVGEALTLFNGSGGEYAASIEQSQGGRVAVAIGEQRAIERESPLALTLAQGVSRGERMDLVVQKATELGVSGVVPVLSERSVVRLTAQQAERRLKHWRAIAVAACEQSGRNRLPAIASPVPLKDFLRTNTDGSMRLLLSPAATATLADLPRLVSAVTVLIGPEGGLAEAEQEAAVAAGFKPVCLGPRVLRTETAAITALALLQREFGDL
jgi:16S rRNA (uracil1498-N3)-methyltransferase